jgi:hypothetical protein
VKGKARCGDLRCFAILRGVIRKGPAFGTAAIFFRPLSIASGSRTLTALNSIPNTDATGLHGRPLSDHRAAFLFETRASYPFGDTWQLVMKTAQLRALRLPETKPKQSEDCRLKPRPKRKLWLSYQPASRQPFRRAKASTAAALSPADIRLREQCTPIQASSRCVPRYDLVGNLVDPALMRTIVFGARRKPRHLCYLYL